MASFSDLDEELVNIENKIKEIEKTFLEELYNLNVEDLEKVAESNGTKDIDDSILDNFKKTNDILNRENSDLDWIYGVLTTPSLSRTQSIVSSPISSSLVSTPTSTSTSTPVSSRSVSSIQEGSTSSIQDNIKDIATNTVTSEVVKTNVESIATNTVKESVGEEEEEEEEKEEEENTIEDQIKNSALEAVRYNIELEKEKSYVRAYPRKQVGIANPKNACYAIATIQMLYSLPFLRKYYTELKKEHYDSIQYDNKRTLKILSEDDGFNQNRLDAKTHLSGITNFFNLMKNEINKSISDNCILITDDTINQQDVVEYLMYMRPIYMYNNAIRILSYQELSCNNGKKVRIPEDYSEEFLSLEIEINGKDLNSCIESFNNNNENEHFDRCKNNDNDNKVSNAKRFYIIPPENRYLLISLKRFNNKGEKQISDVKPNKTIIIGGVKYTLSGVIVHSGGVTTSSGHYLFFQCNKKGDFTTIYNDSSTQKFNDTEYNRNFININGYYFAYTRYPVDQPM